MKMTEDIPERSEFDSVDPAPPSSERSVADLRTILCNENEKMFQRMRALFALRNIGGTDSVDALAAAYDSKSALLKHEIAYVMGQMQDPHAVPHLIERLEDGEEDVMVRHEAAEALGAIGDRTALDVLERFVDDDEVVIAESCEVALDLLEWVASKRLDYSE
jgi:deoxyhypusine monooxygenase